MLIKFYNKLTLDCFQHWRRDKSRPKIRPRSRLTSRIDFSHSHCVYDYLGTPTNFNHSGIFMMGWKNCFPHYFSCAFMFFIIAFRVWHCFVTRFTWKLRSGHFWVTFADANDEKVATTQRRHWNPFRPEHKSSWIKNFKLALQCFDVSENGRRTTNQTIFGLRDFSRFHLKTFVHNFPSRQQEKQTFYAKTPLTLTNGEQLQKYHRRWHKHCTTRAQLMITTNFTSVYILINLLCFCNSTTSYSFYSFVV